MNGRPITQKEIDRIVSLRKTGHSLPEIRKVLGRGNSTVFRYIKKVEVLPEYISALKLKQGGSSKRSHQNWETARAQADTLLKDPLSKEQRLCLIAGLYWGEGNKKELNVINSDPALIKVFISCLEDFGVKKEHLKIGIRIHDDIDKKQAVLFWSHYLLIRPEDITSISVIKGKKVGKLKYGMCRVRVAKGGTYFKLLISLISNIKRQFNAAVVQRIEQGTPKP